MERGLKPEAGGHGQVRVSANRDDEDPLIGIPHLPRVRHVQQYTVLCQRSDGIMKTHATLFEQKSVLHLIE